MCISNAMLGFFFNHRGTLLNLFNIAYDGATVPLDGDVLVELVKVKAQLPFFVGGVIKLLRALLVSTEPIRVEEGLLSLRDAFSVLHNNFKWSFLLFVG